MNKDLSQIKNFFKIEKLKNDKQVIVFLACLLIATSLWFLNALSKEYTTIVSYPIKYINPPKNQFLANKPPEKFDLKVDAYGFTLLRHKLSLSFSPIILNLTNITRNLESNSGRYTINSSGLIRRISDQVSNEINISEIQPEYFEIKFDSLKRKMVPVNFNITTEFKPEFNLKKPITSIPNKVTITGPSSVLDTIKVIRTKSKSFTKIDADINKEVELDEPEGVSVTPKKVELKIEVEKFTEKELSIPVKVLNQPEDKSVKIFPSEIKILFTVGLSEFEKINTSDFSAIVDYNSIEPGSDYLEVTIDKKPPLNQLIRYSPEKVEFLVESNHNE